MKIKIYGYGWVGKAMAALFSDAIVVDPAYGMTSDVTADIGVICVPTPLIDGPRHGNFATPRTPILDCSIVEETIRTVPERLMLIRSTIMPGTCRKLEFETGKQLVYQPEYLGESADHPMLDMKTRPFMILGGFPEPVNRVIELYQSVYNATVRIRRMWATEAEIVKLTENRAIAFKVAQCQELYDVCKAAKVDYNLIREAVYGDDPRFNLWWTFVYPDRRGFNSKCIPKDVYGWAAWAESLGYKPELTQKMLEVNERYIQKEPDELRTDAVGSTHAAE